MRSPAELESFFSASLGVPVLLAFVPGEKGEDHAKGREALGLVAQRLALDVADFRVPHQALSISHSRGSAFAAGTPAPLRGFGIDWEDERVPKEGSERFFLTAVERQRHPTTDPQELLRLWCVKEAVFKADPENKGRTLLHYELDAPESAAGTARGRDGAVYAYASTTEGVGGAMAMAKLSREDA